MRAGCLLASVRESGPKGEGAHEPPDFEGDPDLRFLSYPGPFRVCASLVLVEGGPWIFVSSGQRVGEGDPELLDYPVLSPRELWCRWRGESSLVP